MKPQKLTPCIWFNDQAEEAARFYTALFSDSKINAITHYGAAGAGASGQPLGSVMTVLFELNGFGILGLNGGTFFKPTPAISFFVTCESEKEIDTLWKKLSTEGQVLMALDKYPFAAKYGWCADAFGVSWQLILPVAGVQRAQKICPALLFVGDQAGRAQEALDFYTQVFKNSKIEMIARDPKSNAILHSRFTLEGQDFVALESPDRSIKHDFGFTPGISFVVNCDDQSEIDIYWAKLTADPQAEQCGWLVDQFGVSWQVTPQIFQIWALKNEPEKLDRAMKALLPMKKLDLKAIQDAYEGKKGGS